MASSVSASMSGIFIGFFIGIFLVHSPPALACLQARYPDAQEAGFAGSARQGTENRLPQGVSASAGRPWLNNRFVYEFSPEVAASPGRMAIFEHACNSLLETTALVCTPRALARNDADYVYVINGSHDFSFVGRQGGCQELGILTWSNPMIVAHEIKHALGWAHEQQHPQRDRFIDVHLNDIQPAYQAEFQVTDLGNEGPYDFDSIMHFYPSDFANPGRKAFQLRPQFIGRGVVPGQRDHFSAIDLEEIRAFYGARIPQ